MFSCDESDHFLQLNFNSEFQLVKGEILGYRDLMRKN